MLGNGDWLSLAKVLYESEADIDRASYAKIFDNILGVSLAWSEAFILAVTLGQS